jgi:hypothetical protein
MANRVLKRPMFRMGGSPQFEFQERTTGILSGLDGPKLNASRTGFNLGGMGGVLDEQDAMLYDSMMREKKVGPYSEKAMRDSGLFAEGEVGGEITEDTSDTTSTDTAASTKKDRLEELFEQQLRLGKKFAAEDEGRKEGMPGSMSSALMTFGLNLLGQPGGNLAGAIGKAGAPALSKFQQARMAERLDKRKSEREMRRDALDRAFDLREAEIEADAEIKSAGQDEFAFSAAQRRMEELQGKENTLTDRISVLEKKKEDGSISVEETEELRIKSRDLDNNKELQRLITKEDKEQDEVAVQILKNVPEVYTFEEYENWKKNKEYPKGFRAGSRDGGRAGYQAGGDVVEDVSMMSENMTVSPTAPAQTQNLTYDELRSRLPREITNDVVSLIATSKQALTDFANIQTQQDVDNFNQTYNVNLVLPQEG